LRRVHGQLFQPGLDEHVAREQAAPGRFGDHADGQPILRVRTGEAVLHKQVAALQVGQQAPVLRVEVGGIHRPVDLAPPTLCRGWRVL
jgi:hypothetical protein